MSSFVDGSEGSNGKAEAPTEPDVQEKKAQSAQKGGGAAAAASGDDSKGGGADKTCSACRKPATMACPKCIEMHLPVALFCSQACFKSNWNEHKKSHKAPPVDEHAKTDRDSDLPPEFAGYDFTGPLRPWRKTSMMKVPDHIQKPDYWQTGIPYSELKDRGNTAIRVYSPRQIAGIRKACQIGREVLDIAGRAVRAGVTTDELDRIVYEACVERDAYPSPLNYHRFPKSVCTSVNEVICHGIPDMRELQDGDIVNIDVSTFYRGYHGDLNETFLVGNVDEDGRRLVKCAFDCLAGAMAMVRPDTMYRDIGNTIQKIASAAGCSVVRTYCGHGIGELFHTSPNVPHYAKNKAKGVMKPGHIFTIEPMINLGQYQCVTWPDEWSAVTKDGSRSAQFEHTLLVTEAGYEILTMRDDEPVMEWKPDLLQR